MPVLCFLIIVKHKIFLKQMEICYIHWFYKVRWLIYFLFSFYVDFILLKISRFIFPKFFWNIHPRNRSMVWYSYTWYTFIETKFVKSVFYHFKIWYLSNTLKISKNSGRQPLLILHFSFQPITSSAVYILGEVISSKMDIAQPLVKLFLHHNEIVSIIRLLANHEVSGLTWVLFFY